MSILAVNKRARFDYDILDSYEAGIALKGFEVKAVKSGQVSLRGAYVSMRRNAGAIELFLIGAHIPLYKQAGQVEGYEPTRERKLLLHRRQISHLLGKKQEAGLTLIPLKIYTKHSFVKVEIGVGRGHRKIDKREVIKKREVERQARSLTKRH